MKDKKLEKEIIYLAAFMWKGQVKILKAELAIADLKEMFKTASMNLERLESLIKYNENADKEHPQTPPET